jgi:hypothetical protein
MKKSANELMQEIVYAAVIDAVIALKAASKGLPNSLLRDLNAIHANTTFADLGPELQAAIAASARAGFGKLMKEGYTVAPAASVQPPRPDRPLHRPDRQHRPDRPRGPRPPRRDGPDRSGPGGRPGGPGGRPGGPKRPK